MRKFILFLTMLAVSVSAFAQAQITTKKEKLKDFEVKTMKVVLTGNDFIDPALKEAVKNIWTLSPFEFSSMDEFNAMKGNGDYYFLVPVKAQYKKEVFPGVVTLTLVKGTAGAKDINDLLEVISIPMCSADVPSGREMAMLPGLVDVVQGYVRKSLLSSFLGLKSCIRKKPGSCKVYIAENEISECVSEALVKELKEKTGRIVEDAVADSIFIEGESETAVSYLIAPAYPEKGSVCWKMVIDARTHELYYFKKQTVAKPSEKGFSKSELVNLSSK